MDAVIFILDSFYLSVAGLLVMFMAIGLTLFEAGLIRARNTTDILLKNVALFAITCLVYFSFSFHLMYSDGAFLAKYLPNFNVFEYPVTPELLASRPFDIMVGLFFQFMLAVICVSIISGITAERLRLWPFLFFVIVMVGLIYPVEGYWVWGNGFLKQLGFIDEAGAGVVHLTGAVAGFACLLLLGARNGKYAKSGRSLPLPGANMPIAALGALLIWLGGFGFNGGGIFFSTTQDFAHHMGNIFIHTCLAGSAGLLTSMIISRCIYGTVDLTLVLNGIVVGLVSISAAPMAASISGTIIIASISAVLMVLSLLLMDKLHLDDPVGAIAIHGVGGICALVSVSFTSVNGFSAEANWTHQLMIQLTGIGVLIGWAFVSSLVAWLFIRKVMGLRIHPQDEFRGLDVVGCGMVAYPEFTDSGWEK